jgi:hypothetical protein
VQVQHGDALYGEKEFRRALVIFPKKLMIGLQVAEVNTSVADISVCNFPFFHGRMRTSKLCNVVEVSLGKQQVTPEVQYPPLAGHLLQILQISYHSMKMRCEWLNMALLCSHC